MRCLMCFSAFSTLDSARCRGASGTSSLACLHTTARHRDEPCLCRLAYDGRGNAVVRSSDDSESAVTALGGFEHGLYAERWCPYQKVSYSRDARSSSSDARCSQLSFAVSS